MKTYLKQLAGDDFWRHNAVFFVGSLAVSVLNYLYYPVLARLLNLSDFGEVQVLVSIFLQATIFFNCLGLITVNVVANRISEQLKNHIIFELEKLALVVSALFLIITLILARPLQVFLKFHSALPFVALALSLVASVPLTFRQAYLRGLSRFGAASCSALWAAGTKLIFSGALVYLGWRSFGAMTGIVLAQLLALIYTGAQARRAGFLRAPGSRRASLPDLAAIKPELTYGLFVLVVSIIMTLQFSLDIVVVKHYFNPAAAGLYAGITTVARIIYFATGSIGMVLMSAVKIGDTQGQNRHIIRRSMVLLLALGALALGVFSLVPGLVIKILLGAKYLTYAQLLPRLSLAMLIISAANLLLAYHMALRHFRVMAGAVIGAAATYWLLIFNFHFLIFTFGHITLTAVINSLVLGSLIMLMMVALPIQNLKFKVPN